MKYKILIWGLIFVAILIAIYPKTYEIARTVTGSEIPMENPDQTSPIEISIDGTYHWRWFSDDSFEGKIKLENYEITKNEISAGVTFDRDSERKEGYGRVLYTHEKEQNGADPFFGYLKMNRTGDNIIFAVFENGGWSVGRRGTAITYPKKEYEEIEGQLLYAPERN